MKLYIYIMIFRNIYNCVQMSIAHKEMKIKVKKKK